MMLTEENGILQRAVKSKTKTEEANEKENIVLAVISSQMKDENNLIINKSNLEQSLKDYFSNDIKIKVKEKGDGCFIVTVDDNRNYKVSQTGKVSKIISNTICQYEAGSYFWQYRDSITNVTLLNEIKEIPQNSIAWDVSEAQDNSVQAYIEDDGQGVGTYKLIIMANGNIIANEYSAFVFEDFTQMKSITGLEFFDVSNTTNMYNIFRNCSLLETIDLSTWNTEKVEDMKNMFYNCINLNEANLKNLNTGSLNRAFRMFYNCKSLTELNLQNFSTNSLENAMWMFRDCSQLSKLNIANCKFSEVDDTTGILLNISDSIEIIVKDNSEVEWWNLTYPNITNIYF